MRGLDLPGRSPAARGSGGCSRSSAPPWPRRHRVRRRSVGVLARGPAVRRGQPENAGVPERRLRQGEGVRREVAGHGRLPRHLCSAGRPAAAARPPDEDWQRGRYFWARVGYDRIFKATEGESSPSVAEDRGILSLWGKFTLPGEHLAGEPPRADLRWIGGEYSTRYRFGSRPRGNSSCSTTPSSPTSTSSGSTTRATMGGPGPSTRRAPSTVNRHFRFELNLSQQTDPLPERLG